MSQEIVYDKNGQQILTTDGVLYVLKENPPIIIRNATITPNPVATGTTVLITVEVADNTWNQVKLDFTSWNSIKTTLSNWKELKRRT